MDPHVSNHLIGPSAACFFLQWFIELISTHLPSQTVAVTTRYWMYHCLHVLVVQCLLMWCAQCLHDRLRMHCYLFHYCKKPQAYHIACKYHVSDCWCLSTLMGIHVNIKQFQYYWILTGIASCSAFHSVMFCSGVNCWYTWSYRLLITSAISLCVPYCKLLYQSSQL